MTMSPFQKLRYQGGTLVLRSQKELEDCGCDIRTTIGPGQMLVAVFRGTKPSTGYDVEIGNILEEGSRIIVQYTTQDPDPFGAVGCMMTTPYDYKLVPLSDKEVVFEQKNPPRPARKFNFGGPGC